ncbi:unnamed protein product, partial [Ectocarpus sp. 12 AP-2014]
FESWQDAYKSLDQDAHTKGYVRLVRAASNAQPRACCTTGEECLTSSTAQLFLQVAQTCPMFWARWSSYREDAGMDIRSALPTSGNKKAMVRRWKPPTSATSTNTEMGSW